jgi:hypothetical protein
VTGQVSHYSHENGSRATVKHQKGQVEGTHNVNSYVNETNKGKGTSKQAEYKPGDKFKVRGEEHTVAKVVGGFVKTTGGKTFEAAAIGSAHLEAGNAKQKTVTEIKEGEVWEGNHAPKEKIEKAKKPTKAELTQQAKAEYAKANRGDGSFAKAAELYDAAGLKDKAADARALAKRYGHDDKGAADKSKADTAAAGAARTQAKSATGKARELLLEQADLYEKRAKSPEDNALSARISELHDEIGHAESAPRAVPKEGEVGHEEHTKYGVYHRKGDYAKGIDGKDVQVLEHRGASVATTGGDYHPTKLKHVRPGKIEPEDADKK